LISALVVSLHPASRIGWISRAVRSTTGYWVGCHAGGWGAMRAAHRAPVRFTGSRSFLPHTCISWACTLATARSRLILAGSIGSGSSLTLPIRGSLLRPNRLCVTFSPPARSVATFGPRVTLRCIRTQKHGRVSSLNMDLARSTFARSSSRMAGALGFERATASPAGSNPLRRLSVLKYWAGLVLSAIQLLEPLFGHQAHLHERMRPFGPAMDHGR
jgi:hypothetical protein